MGNQRHRHSGPATNNWAGQNTASRRYIRVVLGRRSLLTRTRFMNFLLIDSADVSKPTAAESILVAPQLPPPSLTPHRIVKAVESPSLAYVTSVTQSNVIPSITGADFVTMPRSLTIQTIVISSCRAAALVELTVASQDPVHKLIPSLLTPKQLTRFLWPLRLPTLSPRRTSQTYAPNKYKGDNPTGAASVPCIRSHRTQRRADVQTPKRPLT